MRGQSTPRFWKDGPLSFTRLVHGGPWPTEDDKTEVGIKGVVDYAEDKHKDDVATPTKKWKFL